MPEGTKVCPPSYVPAHCPYCQGRISIFGEEDHKDFSKLKVICWKCGKHSHFVQDEVEQCYHQVKN